jgi:hypothetical protein
MTLLAPPILVLAGTDPGNFLLDISLHCTVAIPRFGPDQAPQRLQGLLAQALDYLWALTTRALSLAYTFGPLYHQDDFHQRSAW